MEMVCWARVMVGGDWEAGTKFEDAERGDGIVRYGRINSLEERLVVFVVWKNRRKRHGR